MLNNLKRCAKINVYNLFFHHFHCSFQIKLIPGVMIYRFQAPLCFVNCKVFLAKLALKLGPSKQQADEAPGCFSVLWTKVTVQLVHTSSQNVLFTVEESQW